MAGLKFCRASLAVVRRLVLIPVGVMNHERALSRGFYNDHSAAAWRRGRGVLMAE